MIVLRKSNDDTRQEVFTCKVNYSIPTERLIMRECMGKPEKERVLKKLSEHRTTLDHKINRKIRIKLFKPHKEMRLSAVLGKLCKVGRPATLLEAMYLCRQNSKKGLKKKIVVIEKHSNRQLAVSLAYWFDRAWRLNTFVSNRIWQRTYPYEFVYVPK